MWRASASAVLVVLAGVVVAAPSIALAGAEMCTPFGSVGSDNRFEDGGFGPDETFCCVKGIDCDNRCPNCTQVGEPVDTLTGFAWLNRVDLDVSQPWGPPFRFARHYSTAVAERSGGSAIGPGWSHTYSTYLALFGANPAPRVHLFDAERTGEEYNLIAGQYSSLHGGRTLRWDPPTQMYIAERGDGSVWTFSGNGTLKVIRSSDGGEAHLRHGGDDSSCAVTPTQPAGKVCRVDFLFGRQLWFSYTSDGNLRDVALDSAHSISMVQLDYWPDLSLKSAKRADNRAESYDYGFPHYDWATSLPVTLLLHATDADGKLVESFEYAFDYRESDGPARVVAHHTPSSDYRFTWEYLDRTTKAIVRKTHVYSNKENIDFTLENNIVTSACYLDSNLACDTSRMHTYVGAPGFLDILCEREGAGKFRRHERDSQGRVTATSYQSLDPAAPAGLSPSLSRTTRRRHLR
jgi:Domain of unknown function (DUF6531)